MAAQLCQISYLRDYLRYVFEWRHTLVRFRDLAQLGRAVPSVNIDDDSFARLLYLTLHIQIHPISRTFDISHHHHIAHSIQQRAGGGRGGSQE